MKNYLKVIFFPSLFLLFLGAIIPTDSPTPRTGKDYALFFAIDEYDEWQDLNHPISEVREIAADLRRHYDFEVKIIENPTSDQIFRWLKTYRDKTYSKSDQLFILFSGHGYFIEDTEEGFIIPKDGKKDDPFQRSYIPHSRLEKAVDNIPCEHILLAIDACYSGTFDEAIASRGSLGKRPNQGKNENDLFIQRSLQYQGRQYLTSGGKEQTPDRSKFALQLKLALRTFGGADGILTINEIETYLEKVFPIPRSGYFGDHEGGKFLFITNEYGSNSSRAVDPNGTAYRTKNFNGLTWTTQNLNYPIPGASWCYEDVPANCEKYGRLYTWEAAKKACEALGPGWRLPTDQEWGSLRDKYGDDVSAYKALLASGEDTKATGDSGFAARLGGDRSGGDYYDLGVRGLYWSATELNARAAWAWDFLRLRRGYHRLTPTTTRKSWGYSCRCVQD